jgi:hypothetical protein
MPVVGGRFVLVLNWATARALLLFVEEGHNPVIQEIGRIPRTIAGKKIRFYYFCMDLPRSGRDSPDRYPRTYGHALGTPRISGVERPFLLPSTSDSPPHQNKG